MVPESLADLASDLVTLCLGSSLVDRDSLSRSRSLLLAIGQHPSLADEKPALLQIRILLRKLDSILRSNKRTSRRTSIKLAEQLEELSQVLYSKANVEGAVAAGDAAHGVDKPFRLPAEVDEGIFTDFLSNARLTLDELGREAEELREGSADALAAAKRRIHTLKGEAGMLGLVELEGVLHTTESLFERQSAADEHAERLLVVSDWARDALRVYARHSRPLAVPELDPLIAPARSASPSSVREPPAAHQSAATPSRAPEELQDQRPQPIESLPKSTPPKIPSIAALAAAGSETPGSAPWDAEDDELVAEFLREVDEHLSTVDRVLVDSEQSGLDVDRVNRLFRAFHTLKGVASFLHLQQFAELTHMIETMLDRIRSGHPIATPCAIDLAFDTSATLRELGTCIQQSLASHSSIRFHEGATELLHRIRDVIEGNVDIFEHTIASALPGEKLGDILIRHGVVNDAMIQKALETQTQTGEKLGEALLRQSLVPPKAVAQALRAQKLCRDSGTKPREVIKVDLERADCLVETIGELVIVESMVSNAPEIAQLPAHLRNYLGLFAKITRELQELGMFMRMVPVRGEFQKMIRIVRDLGRRTNKLVRIELAGEGTEMDRAVVEQIADPLVHLIRNAVDHGIESADERRAAGKSETATIRLSAYHEGGSIVIEISDDGRGINRERVLAKAISKGLVVERAPLSDSQVYDLMFSPGFSTAQQVSEISGRGVGLDVVKRNIESIRGRVLTTSTWGTGTTFRLILPLTLAIIDAMVIRCGDERYILPTLNIVESLQPSSDMLHTVAGLHEQIFVRGRTLPLVRLSRLLDTRNSEHDPTKALVIIVESLRARVALLVDEVVMKQQVVIKTLNKEVDASGLFAGAAILSDGHVGLIINIGSLIDVPRHQLPIGMEGNQRYVQLGLSSLNVTRPVARG